MNAGIRVASVEVRFGGVTALSNVSLDVQRGQIRGVIGPNGSGKSTLFNAISGFVRLTNGSITIDGTNAQQLTPAALVRMGVARTFQTPRIDPSLTVEQAILCGFFAHARQSLVNSLFRLRHCRREEREFRQRVQQIVARLGIASFCGTPLGDLPMGLVRLVDVGRALAVEPRYLLLDEPAAGLSLVEQQRLASAIRLVAADDVGILLVEHNFDLICELCEQVTVLDRGSVLTDGALASIRNEERFVRSYLGGR